ncbi:MAG: flagellar basal-body rod protein FlgG [Desulfobia sp.]
MIRALYTSRTGMSGQQMNLDTISNNLSNVNTDGYKKSKLQFEDLMYQTHRSAGAETVGGNQVPSGIQIGMGVRPTSVHKIFTQGDFTKTDNNLDMAIEGQGFFQIIRDGQEYYTRADSFQRDSEGYIVTANGDRLQPEFSIPEDATTVEIDRGGQLNALDQEGEIIASSQITLHNFINPAGLKAEGGNLFTPTEASGDPLETDPGTEGVGTIAQNYLESSNVDVTEEMVDMITTQRAFEANSKGITTADQLLEVANQLVR